MNHTGLLVFVKYPEVGKVKTRLGNEIGLENSANIYRVMVEICLKRYHKIENAEVNLFCDPNHGENFIEWLGNNRYIDQPDGDLGERLKYGVSQILRRYSSCIALGTDSPDLPIEYLKDAIEQIQKHDVVIGPAEDGGYYLIGVSKWFPELFEDIDWSSDQVYSQTINKLKEMQLSYFELPKWYDIDTHNELKRYLNNEDPISHNEREQIRWLIE